jgi:CheY-like chemotaxis protein
MAGIILLEPDRQLAQNIQRYFHRAGHQLRFFADPQQAVMSADSGRPDAIILNLFLATRSGIEFLYELRSYPEWSDIPIIATGSLSAGELKDYGAALEELRVTAYLPKQTSRLSDLLSAVQASLHSKVV